MASTIAQFSAFLKEVYLDPDRVNKLQYAKNPFLASLEKKGSQGVAPGRYIYHPYLLDKGQGISGTFGVAQAASSNTVSVAVQVPIGTHFGVVYIDDLVIKSSETITQSFMKAQTLEIDQLYEQKAEILSLFSWSNGGNSMGRVGSISGNDITLSSPNDAANFEVNRQLSGATNDGSSGVNAALPGSTYVTRVNRGAGVITVNDATAIVGLAAGNYLFNLGDYLTPIMRGLQAFVTPTDSPPDLWNITAAQRLTDVQRLSGCRPQANDVNGLTIDERLTKMCALMVSRFKTNHPKTAWTNPEDFQQLESILRGRGYRLEAEKDTGFGFETINFATPAGRVTIMSDRHCPKGQMFLLNMDEIGLHWLGPGLLHPQTDSTGLVLSRVYNATTWEYRLFTYPAFLVTGMVDQGRVPAYG